MVEVTRRVELYTMHGHRLLNDNYDLLFRHLSRLKPEDRVIRSKGGFVGFPIFEAFESGYFVQVIEGTDGEAPLVFDLDSGATRNEQLATNEIYAHATHLFVLANERRALIEYVRRGAKSVGIGNAIEQMARQHLDGYQSMRIEITPIVGKGFTTQISGFDRIREASIRVVEPNASWSDHYTALCEVIDGSNGSSATLDVKASRGESLAKDKGIVSILRDVVADKEPYLKEATITGTRHGETSETTVRASKFTAQTQLRVQADVSKNVAPTDFRKKLAQVATSLSNIFK